MPRQPAASRKAANTKIFVLDTKVLMPDPTGLYRFECTTSSPPPAASHPLGQFRALGPQCRSACRQADT